MQTIFEEIAPEPGSSIRILVNPKLHDFYYWHYHPEIELVFINKASGNRHVGHHLSPFFENDLVLIGPNIPHLNFDYGIKTEYEKAVVQFLPTILGTAFQKSIELSGIQTLLQKANYGIAFGTETKKHVKGSIQQLHKLNGIKRLLSLLEILQQLSEAKDYQLLHKEPYPVKVKEKEESRLKRIYTFIDQNYTRKIEISEIAGVASMSPAAFCRYFKRTTHLTFTQFLNNYRIDIAKKLLLTNRSISETAWDCGFESLSYFNQTFKNITSENPSHFKKRILHHQ